MLKTILSNRITRDGAAYLAQFLQRDTPLKTLDLGNNRIEDDGAKAIAEALMYANTNLERLNKLRFLLKFQ